LAVVRYAPCELHAKFSGAFELDEHLIGTHHAPGSTMQQFVH
jgi:hypothetical protein